MLVEANKKLIEIFEQKIKDKIAEVWGDEQLAETSEPGISLIELEKKEEMVEATEEELKQGILFAS